MEKRHFLQQMVLESWMATYKSMKLEHILIPYMKINPKWLIGLNIKHDTIKLLKKNISNY